MSLLLLFHPTGGLARPTVTTDGVSDIARTKAIGAGTVVSDGGDPIQERGFVVAEHTDPTISDRKYIVSGQVGSFTALLAGLKAGVLYYVRAYAINNIGIRYGDNVTFTTLSAIVQKIYAYRIYDEGQYVGSWTKEVISEPNFTVTINGGAGQLVVRLARSFDDFGEDVDVKLNNKVECWCIDGDNPNGVLIYSGYISGYKPSVSETTEQLEITIFGYVAELQRMLLRDGSDNYTLTYNSYDPSVMLKDVIDKYRAQGGSVRYTADSIDLTGTSVSYTFNTNMIKECVDKIIELCPEGWYWYIDSNNVIYLRAKPVQATHSFTLGLNVEKLETFRRVEDVANRVLVVGGGSPALFRKYENTGSQGAYGLYETKIVDQRVTVVATAAVMANRLLNTKKDPEIRSIFTIIDNNGPRIRGYDIETVKPGQTLQVKNLKADQRTTSLWDMAVWDIDVWDQTLATSAADVIQILSVNYTPDSIKIEASSRLPQIAKRIEDVQRNLEVTQMVENPVAPT